MAADNNNLSSISWEEKLTCQKCHKLLEDPKVLPCLHIMCKACVESVPSREGGVYCPLCQTSTSIPRDKLSKLPTAFAAANLIEAKKTLERGGEGCESCGSTGAAVAFCNSCTSFLCMDCYNNHHVMKGLKGHKVVGIDELDSCHLSTKTLGPVCCKHTSRKLELYCCSCESPMCYECAYFEHPQPQHQVKRLKDCITPFKEAVHKAVTLFVHEVKICSSGKACTSGEIDSLLQCENELHIAMEALDNKKVELLECDQGLVESIKQAFARLVQFLQERESMLLSDVKSKVIKNREGQVADIEQLKTHIKTVQSFVKYLDEQSHDEEFVSMKHLVCARIEQLSTEYRKLQQKLNSDIAVARKVSCSNLSEGVCHLTVAVGDNVLFSARTITSFHEQQPAVIGPSPCPPSSIPEEIASDKTPDSSQGQTSSSNGSGGASSYYLSHIMAAVSTISGQWKELGSGLGLQPAILDAIQGPPEACMAEVIKHWVRGTMEASRQRLSSVLVRMGRADLAEGMMAGVEKESTGSSLDDVIRGPPLKPLHTMPLNGLSPGILYLLGKLPDGDIEGVVYKPSESTAIIQGPTPEAVDEIITKFQFAYQKTMSSKVEDIPHAPNLDSNLVLYLVAKLNSIHNQCAFIYMEEKHMVRLISGSPRHFDPAKKELNECLDQVKSSKHKSPLFAIKICEHRVLTLKQSDIVTEEVDVIVNPTNEDLSHGAGVARALDRASGGGLQDVSRAYIAARGPVQIGDMAVTASGGGALKCKRVYHVVGPKAVDYVPKDCRRLIEQIIKKALVTAETFGVLSIAIPNISSGVFGVDTGLVAAVIIDTIINHQFSSRPSVLGDIRIVIIDSPTFDCFAKYFNQRKKEVTTTIPTAADVVKKGSVGTTSAEAVGDIPYPDLSNGSIWAVGVGDGSSFQGMTDSGTADEQKKMEVPDCKTQKEEIQVALQQKLIKGDSWYLVDIRWLKQWKKYVGYDALDQSSFGHTSANPGPLDNSILFRDRARDVLKDHLMEELDYYLLPKPAWEKLLSWYGLSEGSQPIERKVVKYGLYKKHCKVEVYLMDFKLCQQSQLNETIPKLFSRATTIAQLEAAMRELFNVAKEAECRVWHRYMSNTYEQLNKPKQTLQDAGLYAGQTLVLERKNADGTWHMEK